MKIIIKVLLLISGYFLIFYFVNYSGCGSPKSFPTILTLLSILTGFTITALSIIATSKFSNSLYKIESKTNNSLTLLHELIYQFKYATIFFAINILAILIFEFFDLSFNCTLDKTFVSLIWLLTFVSIFTFLELLNIFVKFILKSATANEM